MARLIDADALIVALRENPPVANIDRVIRDIDAAPTVVPVAFETLEQSWPSNMDEKDKPLRITRCSCGKVIVYRGKDVCPNCGRRVKWDA